jgi:DNA polymerase III alpha subunit (gram-positive type)
MRFFPADVETTGVKNTDKVCELAWLEIDCNFNTIAGDTSLINPEIPIHYAASAVNGITDQMVADAPTIGEYMALRDFPLASEDAVLIAHNCAFDHRFLKEFMHENAKTLCTMKVAKVVYPDADNYKQATLAAMLGIKVAREKAHSADGDLDVLLQLLKCLCRDAQCDLEGLLEIQNVPRKITKLNFGKKHYGKKLEDVPKDYVDWMLRECKNLDPDLRAALVAL